MPKKNEITQQEYLAAFGLFTLASQAQRDSDRAIKALAKHLGYDDWNDADRFMDEIYSPSHVPFDELLKRENIDVQDAEKVPE